MRLVVQRVSSASVCVGEDKIVGTIADGLLVLVGIKKGDTEAEARILAAKLARLRVMADKDKKMNLPAKEFLVVSQFTLYADTSRGNRPSFVNAEDPQIAETIYEYFVASLRNGLGDNCRVEMGSFGDYMEISANLDGPVTIVFGS